jgi:hypothetical protein
MFPCLYLSKKVQIPLTPKGMIKGNNKNALLRSIYGLSAIVIAKGMNKKRFFKIFLSLFALMIPEGTKSSVIQKAPPKDNMKCKRCFTGTGTYVKY